ncbi:MAG: class I SAM-dependent methyltransferase [Nitrospirota bacterium]
MNLIIDESVKNAWETWLSVTRKRCHIHYELEGGSIESHINICYSTAFATSVRIAEDIDDIRPARILEIGCSVGFNCFALKHLFPNAEVVGIEPDEEAVHVGTAMAIANDIDNLRFVHGFGERLPFDEGHFDLVVCHTVIEHVYDVAKVIAEMSRVLSSKGIIHLEAPNYIWPREPHLNIWCIPLLGKSLIRNLAKLQMKKEMLEYIEHLQLVYPHMLERLFIGNNLVWENRIRAKIEKAASGESGVIKAYHGLGSVLQLLNKIGLTKIVSNIVIALGLYPSVMYTLRKAQTGENRSIITCSSQ